MYTRENNKLLHEYQSENYILLKIFINNRIK